MARKTLYLPQGIGGYVNLLKPRAFKPGKPLQYGLMVMWPKEDPATLKKLEPLRALIREAAVERFGPSAIHPKTGELVPPLKGPIHDGDMDRPNDRTLKGMLYVSVKTYHDPNRKPPLVVDAGVRDPAKIDPKTGKASVVRKPQQITTEDECYSGCTFLVNTSVVAYENDGKGVSLFLNGAQVVRKGARLAGATMSEDDFETQEFEEVEESAGEDEVEIP